MLILTIRTDKPEAELGLFENGEQLAYETWLAHRQLAETIHLKIGELLKSRQKNLDDIEGLVVFKGPGSFTGLRIGTSIANALAAGLNVPVVATADSEWLEDGARLLTEGKNEQVALPEYGAEPHITEQKR